MAMRLGDTPRRGKTPEAVPDTEKVRLAFLNTLGKLQGEENDRVRTYGHRYENYTSAIQELQSLRGAPDALAFIDVLFRTGVPAGVIETLAAEQRVQFPSGSSIESYIKHRFFGGGVVNETAISFKKNEDGVETEGGREWLAGHVAEHMRRRHFDMAEAHQVQALARQAEMSFGSGTAALVRLMYMCMDESVKNPAEKLRRVISARLTEKREQNEGAAHYIQKMNQLTGVYADITAKVLAHTRDDEKRRTIVKNVSRTLSDLVQYPYFQISYDERKGPPNPFTAFGNILKEHRDRNPWLTDDCAATPFNIERFGDMISEEVPRGLVAEAVTFLNSYRTSLYAQRLTSLIRSLAESKRKRGTHEMSPHLQQLVDDAILRIQELTGEAAKEHYGPDEKAQMVTRFVDKHLIFSPDSKSGIHPFSILLRLLDAKKIATNSEHKDDFIALLQNIPRFEATPENRGKIAIIASSIQHVLQREDPYLDLPLLGAEDEHSIRSRLTTRAQQWFSDDVLKFGPFPPESVTAETPISPLILPRDRADMSAEELTRMRRNFDTAKGVDMLSKREWISRPSTIWNDLPRSYDNILNFARRQAEKFYGMSGKYGITFYPSATSAMNDVVSRLFAPVRKGDYIVTSNQEYGGMTDAFTNHGAEVAAIRFHDRARGKAKTIDSIYEEMVEEIVRRGEEPRAFLFSSKTRFGDALGVQEGYSAPNAYGLGLLIKRLKEQYPAVPVVVDGAQSAGRNDLGENNLERLGCDMYINSGSKGLGVENVAMLAIKRNADWLSHIDDPNVSRNPLLKLSPGKSTVDIRRVAALGIALQTQNGRIDTWRTPDEFAKLKQLRERVAERMQDMTKYAIARAADHAEAVLTHPRFPFAAEVNENVTGDSAVQWQFGCHVVYPVHRKKIDYNGVITVAFPNISAMEAGQEGEGAVPAEAFLKTELYRAGYLVEQCLAGRNGVRISFHYLHEERDIDELFNAIADIHVSYLRREVRRKSIKNLAELREKTLNRSSTWIDEAA